MYNYPTVENQKVPSHRDTEPALQANFEAIHQRKQRDKEDADTNFLDSAKEELRHRSRSLKYQIYEIGKLLCAVKKELPHGEFKPWVEANFEHGYRTAHNCMKVYIACMGHPEVVEYFNPSCLYVLAKPDFPDDLREALFNEVSAPVDVSKKELVQLSMKYKNGEISTEDEEVQNVLKKQRNTTIWEKYKSELEALNKLLESRLERIKNITKRKSLEPLIDEEKEVDEEKEDEIYRIESNIEKMKAELHTMIDELEQKCN